MKFDQIYAVYFSATGTTKKIVTALAGKLAEKLPCTSAGTPIKVHTIDFSLPAMREKDYVFQKGDLVIFGLPVYAGRIPNLLLPFVRDRVHGGGAVSVPIVLFGNRNFDDALIELDTVLCGNGFQSVAAAAFVGEHSFSKILGKGRPDESDMDELLIFADNIAKKLDAAESPDSLTKITVKGETPVRPYYTPRDRNGTPINILKVKPKTDDSLCTGCGHCADICTMGSIPHENVKEVNGICTKCCACVKGCPAGAKYYDDEGYLYHQHELEEMYERRAENSLFI